MKHKLIGIYQIITGIFGALLIIINFGKVYNNKELFFAVFLGIVLFAGVVYAGYSLYKGFRNAVRYSIISMAMQSIGIIYNGTQYLFSGAAFASVIYKTNHIHFNFQTIPIAFNISEVSKSIPVEITVFFLPLFFILLLLIKK